jgi:hypothetical protein
MMKGKLRRGVGTWEKESATKPLIPEVLQQGDDGRCTCSRTRHPTHQYKNNKEVDACWLRTQKALGV